ncbi:uncharacterized protein LOC127251339 [Andrographis paniculata]|uniref:uncharacterized protein LOC127251339 n=1 Tax=Andrographis paniculata TaxID=175694 RepID=UPI0021E7D571|nr:uncharacterized protein LOC127251339 [Andrographis paniculata]
MMAHKQLLHELLKEDQEPFRLQSYITDRRSQLKKPPAPPSSTGLQLRKRKPILPESSTKRSNFTKHACFLSFQNSPGVSLSPSPAKSPRKSPVFLHIPSGTAAKLVEAAMRIQKQQQSKPNSQNLGFGLFGSFLKRLKDRKRNKNRAIQNNEERPKQAAGQPVRISTCRIHRRLSSAHWTDNNEEDISMDFEASTSGYGSDCSEDITSDFDSPETRFCTSPFVFSFNKSPSSNGGRRTPDFCSPASSPTRQTQKKENEETLVQEDEEEKEQCSPVSVLDAPFEDDEGCESGDAEADDYDPECSYANVQRAKEQLLNRLRRFERLAELDPLELEQKLLEGSDNDDLGVEEVSEDEGSYSLSRRPSVQTLVSEAFIQSSLQCHYKKMSLDIKKLATDPAAAEVKGESEISRSDNQEKSEFTIIEMIGLELKNDSDEWTKFAEQVDSTAADIAVAIFALLVEEVSDELLY